MAEGALDGIRLGIRICAGGPLLLQKEVYDPCSSEIVTGLQRCGGSEDLEGMQIPDILVTQPMRGAQASAWLPIFYSITCFIGAGIAGWVVKKVCDAVYDQTILPAIRRHGGKLSKERQRGLNLEVRAFFETDQVLVRVVAGCSTEDDYAIVEKLVPVALQHASEFIGRNGITGSMYSYRVINGQLSTVPAISPTMLSASHFWDDSNRPQY